MGVSLRIFALDRSRIDLDRYKLILVPIRIDTRHRRFSPSLLFIHGLPELDSRTSHPALPRPQCGPRSPICGVERSCLLLFVTFAAGPAVCTMSKSRGRLITSRSIQSSAAGGMNILTNIVISDLFSMRVRYSRLF